MYDILNKTTLRYLRSMGTFSIEKERTRESVL